jgi:hypothetical protein
MSATSHEQHLFGSHAANADARWAAAPVPRRAPSRTRAWTVAAMSEVGADDELSTLCRRAADALAPAARTAVVLVGPRRALAEREGPTAASIATSSPSTTAVVRIEWLLREGPVRTSLESGETTVSSRLDEDGRWPRFARAVPGHDTASAAVVPIPLGPEAGSGALAAYSQDQAAFDPRDLRVLGAFAWVIADLVAREPLETDVEEAEGPETARLVNQAVGVLITHHCDEEQAIRRLTRISESTRQPLAAAARMIVNEARAEAQLANGRSAGRRAARG